MSTARGRHLFCDLNADISSDRVALIGRNGVGKSTLLKMLSGEVERPEVVLHTQPYLVPQNLGDSADTIRLARKVLTKAELVGAGLPWELLSRDACSPGEQRKLELLAARKAEPELLILDEPTSDLDRPGIDWLTDWLARWSHGLLLVSHNRRLLRHFHHFFVIAESGCRYLTGDISQVEDFMAEETGRKQRQYVRDLNALVRKEEKNERVNGRHDRKKNRGRLNELGRCPSRAKLNEKRSYAQVKQGKRKKLWAQRISASRAWAKAARRALDVHLDLTLVTPELPDNTPEEIVVANSVSAVVADREIFSDVSLAIRRTDRVLVSGRNGAGKSTLLAMLAGRRTPTRGSIAGDFSRLGLIEQGAENWELDEGLTESLQVACGASLEQVAELLMVHRFPLALASRPLNSLSPGERVRAALICLYHRSPAVELLVLDEPTVGLDFVGIGALRDALKVWPGALVVASHDRDFVDSLSVGGEINLEEGKRTGGDNIELLDRDASVKNMAMD